MGWLTQTGQTNGYLITPDIMLCLRGGQGKSISAQELLGHQEVRVAPCIPLFVLYILLISVIVVAVCFLCCSVKLPLS